jgi:hypothetical protein
MQVEMAKIEEAKIETKEVVVVRQPATTTTTTTTQRKV